MYILKLLTWENSVSSEALKYQLTEAAASTSPLILQEMQPNLKPLLATASVSESTSTQAPWHRDATEWKGWRTQLETSCITLLFVYLQVTGFRAVSGHHPLFHVPVTRGKACYTGRALVFSISVLAGKLSKQYFTKLR